MPNNGLKGSPPSRHRGLTLIELLVAISVLGFVAVLGWRGLDSIVRARVALTSDLEQTRGLQLTFAQMQSDCAHMAGPATLGNRVPLVTGRDQLTLVRTVLADNQPTRLQIVSYRLKEGVLTRHESAATRDLRELDKLWRSSVQGIDETPAVTLQSGVAGLTMRLWVNDGWRAGAGAPPPAAGPAENPPVNTTAPTGLEVTLQLQGQGRESGLLKIFMLGAV